MTIRPSDNFQVRGVKGPVYKTNTVCAHPTCREQARHGHHMFPRSSLRNQPLEWVEIPDYGTVQNRVGLCVPHHEQVTGMIGGHRARISFDAGLFWWQQRLEAGWEQSGLPLDPQPFGASRQVFNAAKTPDLERCETCGHVKPKQRKPLAPRKTKTWTADVPDDAEIGSDVLDEWVDDVSSLLGFGDQRSRLRRYHTMAVSFAWIRKRRDEFIRDLVEASEA